MPSRGSKAQLIHLLASDYSRVLDAALGETVHPAEFYDSYSYHTKEELAELAAGLRPRSPGRPPRGSKFDGLPLKVDDLCSRTGMSI